MLRLQALELWCPLPACYGNSYTLPNGSTIGNIQNDTTIDIVYPTSGGCNTRAIIALNVIRIDTTVHLNGLTLSAVGATANSYQWIDCINNNSINNASNVNYSVTAVGSYAVAITNGNCIDTSSCYPITTQQILNGGRLLVNAYPNPARDQLQVSVQSDDPGRSIIRIYNSYGTLVSNSLHTLTRGNNLINLPVASLPSGVYQLVIERSNGTITKKSFMKL